MIKLYHENVEFNEYTLFDTLTGKLKEIPLEDFMSYLPSEYQDKLSKNKIFQRIETENAVIFTGETPATHTRFPRRIYFQITRQCNLKCPACFIKADKNGGHVPMEAVMNIAEFMSQNGLMEVRLTGGEPTLHPGFLDILHKFQQENIYVSIATNGTFDKKMRDALCKENNLWIICSIDGNRETHNKYRPGTYDLIVENLMYIKSKRPDLRLRLTTVLTKENRKQMFELGKLCEMLKAESITIIPLRPQVRDSDVKNDMVNAQEFKEVIEDLIKVKEKYGVNITTTLETDFKYAIYADPIFRKHSSCAAGREGSNLDYDPKKKEFLVYGCSYSPAVDLSESPAIRKPFLAGTFPEDKVHHFLNIWEDDSAWALFRDISIKSKDCLLCDYFKRHQCIGSCPIQNVDLGTLNANQDALSQLKEKIQKTGEWYCYQKVNSVS